MLLGRHLISLTSSASVSDTADSTAVEVVRALVMQYMASPAAFKHLNLVQDDQANRVTLSYTVPPGDAGPAINIKWSGHAEEMEAVVALAFAMSPERGTFQLAAACGSPRPNEQVLTRYGGGLHAEFISPSVALEILMRQVRIKPDDVLILLTADHESVGYALRPRSAEGGRGTEFRILGRSEDVTPLTILIKLLARDDTAIDAYVDLCRAQHRLRAAAQYVR